MRYDADPRFRDYYFEDSWVLGVEAGTDWVTFELEAVLANSHLDFGPPELGEQYRYRHAWLHFEGATEVRYAPSGAPPATDANGDLDYGNIDCFEIEPPAASDPREHFVLRGEWGALTLRADRAFVKED